MPELPEVQCVVNSLASVKGKKVKNVNIFNHKLREPVQENLSQLLKDKTIIDVIRRGKFIIFKLDNGDIVSHLGMTGKFLIHSDVKEEKHARVQMEFTDGTDLIYSDIRKFGFLTYEKTAIANKYIKNLGVEPLTENFTGDFLYNITRSLKKNVKQFLLDQSYIVGLGNIYVIELMYICKINPMNTVNQLTRGECEQLVDEIKLILEKSIKAGGSSISDYRDAFDKEGSFQDNFFVYGKDTDPLGHKVERIKQNGRGTYYCPICQK